ncbi:hypothetical protein AB0B89_36590 [Sphaerisporangium sp. NPDC049002]|uniref:hypothetical protein n=1 Tax=Sphaerisporangium sp. NPDC049002 TaxID=3155392 RepID=UPI0033F9B394
MTEPGPRLAELRDRFPVGSRVQHDESGKYGVVTLQKRGCAPAYTDESEQVAHSVDHVGLGMVSVYLDGRPCPLWYMEDYVTPAPQDGKP